jgi:rubrerythrin
MEKFNCQACGYSIKREDRPKKCPYCGKTGLIDKEEDAQEIIAKV